MTDGEFVQEIARRERTFMYVFVSDEERSQINRLVSPYYWEWYPVYKRRAFGHADLTRFEGYHVMEPAIVITLMTETVAKQVADKLLT